MVSRPRLLLLLLPLLLVAWSGCPCVYSQWIADVRGDDFSPAECPCPCCCKETVQEPSQEGPTAPQPNGPPPCERRSARNADLPPDAPRLIVDVAQAPLLAAVWVEQATIDATRLETLVDWEPPRAPPHVLRAGIVLLN